LSVISTILLGYTFEDTITESGVVNNTTHFIFLVSNDVINSHKFLFEDKDNFVNSFNITSKSFNFSHVENSVSFKKSFFMFNGSGGVFPGLEGFDFIFLSKNEIVFKFGSISGLDIEVHLEDVDFFFRFLDEINSISTGSNFSSNEGFEGSFEFNFKFIKSSEKFV